MPISVHQVRPLKQTTVLNQTVSNGCLFSVGNSKRNHNQIVRLESKFNTFMASMLLALLYPTDLAMLCGCCCAAMGTVLHCRPQQGMDCQMALPLHQGWGQTLYLGEDVLWGSTSLTAQTSFNASSRSLASIKHFKKANMNSHCVTWTHSKYTPLLSSSWGLGPRRCGRCGMLPGHHSILCCSEPRASVLLSNDVIGVGNHGLVSELIEPWWGSSWATAWNERLHVSNMQTCHPSSPGS